MKIGRYSNNYLIAGGRARATSYTIPILRLALARGRIKFRIETLVESMRIDQIAGRYLGDSTLWWIIAALSDIGWSMQVPAGTRIIIPLDLKDIEVIT